jgi:hypothetical protein
MSAAEIVVRIDGEPFQPPSVETMTRLGEPEPEMFSFEWTKQMLGLDILEAEWQRRNQDQNAWEREQAEQHKRDLGRMPEHD